MTSCQYPDYLPTNLKKSQVWNKNNGLIQSKESYLKVFPNPAVHFFIIEYHLKDNSNRSTIELLDIYGKILKHWTLSDIQNQIIVSTNDLSSGIYMLRVIDNSQPVETLKVTITK